jgi:peptide/nickel transport system permease protein
MNAYARYAGRRLLLLLATVFIAMTVVFFVPRLVPGEPMAAIFANMASVGGSMNAEVMIAEYRARFGLDEPLWVQYVSFWRELFQGNLGISISNFPVPVGELLIRALPWTLGLLIVTTLLSWIFGSLVGAAIGWRGRKAGALRLVVPVALVLYTTPYYILALILIYLFAFQWPIFPLSGAYSVGNQPGWTWDFISDVLHHAMLPALSILLVSLGWWFLSMRSLIIALKGEDYILNADAMGIRERRILWGYAFRNALLPQTTGLAIALGHIVGGALITEVIFAYPGVGYQIYNGIKSLDYPLIQGGVLLIILSVALANFVIDVAYPLIDPRIRFGASAGKGA